MTHVLLLGGSGFIGCHVHDALRAHPGIRQVSMVGKDRCDLVAADAADIGAVLGAHRPDVVVNCTGRLDGSTSELIAGNTLVTAKLVEALSGSSVRLVRVGSAGEYGPVPHGHAVDEEHPAAPASEYGLSHLAATGLVELAAAAGRVDGVSLRVFNPIGAGMPSQTVLGQVALRLRHALSAGSTTVTVGPLSAYRDFVDARDVASAVVAAALAPRLPYRVFNVGSARAVAVRQAVQLLAAAAGYTGQIVQRGAGAARSAAVQWMLADITRTTRVLGWRPVHELDESVKAVWATTVRTRP